MIDSQTQELRAWHALARSEVQEAAKATAGGLSEAEAAARLEQYGPNRLPEQHLPSVWQIILRQFYSPLIYVLVAAAVVSLAIGETKDAAFIAAVLAINAAIGAYQEWKAEQSSLALRRLPSHTTDARICSRLIRHRPCLPGPRQEPSPGHATPDPS